MQAPRPSRDDLFAARDRGLPDLISPDLDLLFCGINPGLYSAAVGHHFARPGNRFWPAIHAAGFTSRLLRPEEERELLRSGTEDGGLYPRCGITNIVDRATAQAQELGSEELIAGGRLLERKVERFKPRCIAILGVDAYRKAFVRPRAGVGLQEELFAGAHLWVVPSPSGLNAFYQPRDLVRVLVDLRESIRDAWKSREVGRANREEQPPRRAQSSSTPRRRPESRSGR